MNLNQSIFSSIVNKMNLLLPSSPLRGIAFEGKKRWDHRFHSRFMLHDNRCRCNPSESKLTDYVSVDDEATQKLRYDRSSSSMASSSHRSQQQIDMDMSFEEDGSGFSTSLSSSTAPQSSRRPNGARNGKAIPEEDRPEFLTDVEQESVGPALTWLYSQRDLLTLSYAVLIGGVVAGSVFIFDLSIEYIHNLPDILAGKGIGGGRSVGLPITEDFSIPFRCVMPIGAGFIVAYLGEMGFAPPLKIVTRAFDSVQCDKAKLPKDYGQVARKALASAITLGSGASLGPEAPSVELGANTAAVITPKNLSRRRQRMLLAAGAAAGVSAAFDAPVAGALFAVEFVLKSSRLGLDRLSTSTVFVSTSVAAGAIHFLRDKGQALGIGGAGHLVGRIPYFSMQPNLLFDVAEFGLLGVFCASAAVSLYEGVRISEIVLRPLPRMVSAPLAGALCGTIAFWFPQVQYGYVNLEQIFRDSTNLSVFSLVTLLIAKVAATSICVGGGLVGGLFAPSLFLGALVGDIVGHFFTNGVADNTTFVVVGAAAVLGASCRAPLTAIALMVEITRDTGLLVPLLAAIGTASLVTDYLEGSFSKWVESQLVEMYLNEKSAFWGASGQVKEEKKEGPVDAVQSAMSVQTSMYVRNTLPLQQAANAMLDKRVAAAVVVDEDFSPLGVVYLEDVKEEIVRQRLELEQDNNFGRAS